MENELLCSAKLNPIFERDDRRTIKAMGETNGDCLRAMDNMALSRVLGKLISVYVGESQFISTKCIKGWLDGPPTIMNGPILKIQR